MNRREFVKGVAFGMFGGACLGSFAAYSNQHKPVHRLIASRGSHEFSRDQSQPTDVMFYNQSIPGPVLRIKQGEETTVLLENNLDQATSIHWHGLRIANSMDGVPGMTQDPVQPGEKYTYRFTPPDAGTYWYHTHQRAWEQLSLGLAGVLIVEEDNPPLVDQDLLFVIDDWRIDNSMQIDRQSLGALHDWAHGGRMGNFISVNGEGDKSYRVSKGERVRLRVLNIANSRTMTLRFNLPGISVISVDGQPVKPFALARGIITLATGQRADLMIDMTLEPNHQSPIELLIRDQAYQVALFNFDDQIKRDLLLDTSISLPQNPVNKIQLPEQFMNVPLYIEGGAMGRMEKAVFQGSELPISELIQHKKIWALNGIAGLADEPVFSVKRGTAVNLEINNDTSWPHGIHVHGHHFIDDRDPSMWRDTALFARGEKGSLKFVGDNPGKWLIHCHMIEHQAGGMVTWFEVT